MPIYEYRCPKCNKVFEEWCPHITEEHPKEPCPSCGTMSSRIISHTSFVLEGGGWYVTDYGYRKGIKEDGESSGSSPSSGSAHDSGAGHSTGCAAKAESKGAAQSTATASAAATPVAPTPSSGSENASTAAG